MKAIDHPDAPTADELDKVLAHLERRRSEEDAAGTGHPANTLAGAIFAIRRESIQARARAVTQD